MDIQNYSEEYQRKTDDELLLIAARADQLVPEANAALNAEMARRGLNEQTLQGRVMEWREEAKRSREGRATKNVLFHVVWMVLLALMGFGVTLMNRCSGR
jgi:hypothetical protein